MLKRNMIGVLSVVVLIAAVCTTMLAAAEKPDTALRRPLPDPDGKPAAAGEPVKVFILMGQSNMLGFGRIAPEAKQGTLEYLAKKEGEYPHLLDDQGNWTQREDVRC